jgi:hypothetical protein
MREIFFFWHFRILGVGNAHQRLEVSLQSLDKKSIDFTNFLVERRLFFVQALGLISKVQLTEGRGRKPAFQYIGPPVEDLEITEEQKQEMPAIRYRTLPTITRSTS